MTVRAAVCVLLWMPLIGWGAALSQQELQSALRASANAARGEQLFTVCLACHAADGGGSRDGNVPAIAGQHSGVIVKQLVDFRHNNRWDIRMERYSSDHVLTSAGDIAAVAAFVSALPEQRSDAAGGSVDSDNPRQQFNRLCAACHGVTADGDNAERVPRLAGQNHLYLLRQMQYALEDRRPNLSQEHVALLKRFEMADLEIMARYLAGLRAAN
jgi:cytochrome c553